MKKVNWSEEEAVALIDLYYHNGQMCTVPREYIQELSQLYNRRAKILGLDIDEKFRNVSGLNMQIACIHYVATNGKAGLSGGSKVFYQTNELCKSNPQRFQSILDDFYKKYSPRETMS